MPRPAPGITARLLVAVALMCFLAAPSSAPAQERDPAGTDGASFDTPQISLAVNAARGPDHHAAGGVEIEYRLASWLGVLAEYSGWTDGYGMACLAAAQPGYGCIVSGRAAMAGIRLHRPSVGPVAPYAELLAGRFTPERQESSTAAGLGAGAEFHFSSRWQLRLGGRYLRAFDDRYESLVGESLDYAVLNLGVVLGFGG